MTQTVFRRVMSSILRRRLPHFYISAHSPSLADRGLQDPPVFQRKCQGAGGEEWPGQGTGPHKSSAGSARGSEGGPGQSPAPTGCSAGSAGGIGGGMAGRGLLAPQLCRKMAGKIGHHLAWTQPGAKRGKRRKSLRPRTKTTSLAAANAAERPRKVRCQAHPAEEWQDLWALVQTSPRNSAPAPFLFWTVHGPFSLFGATEKRKWGVHCPAIIMAEIPPARQGE